MRIALLSSATKSRRMSSYIFCRCAAPSKSCAGASSSPSGGGEGSCVGVHLSGVSFPRRDFVARWNGRSSTLRSLVAWRASALNQSSAMIIDLERITFLSLFLEKAVSELILTSHFDASEMQRPDRKVDEKDKIF